MTSQQPDYDFVNVPGFALSACLAQPAPASRDSAAGPARCSWQTHARWRRAAQRTAPTVGCPRVGVTVRQSLTDPSTKASATPDSSLYHCVSSSRSRRFAQLPTIVPDRFRSSSQPHRTRDRSLPRDSIPFAKGRLRSTLAQPRVKSPPHTISSPAPPPFQNRQFTIKQRPRKTDPARRIALRRVLHRITLDVPQESRLRSCRQHTI